MIASQQQPSRSFASPIRLKYQNTSEVPSQLEAEFSISVCQSCYQFFAAERVALLQCLLQIVDLPPHQYMILIDSISALQ